jgi:hypothetical protein
MSLPNTAPDLTAQHCRPFPDNVTLVGQITVKPFASAAGSPSVPQRPHSQIVAAVSLRDRHRDGHYDVSRSGHNCDKKRCARPTTNRLTSAAEEMTIPPICSHIVRTLSCGIKAQRQT